MSRNKLAISRSTGSGSDNVKSPGKNCRTRLYKSMQTLETLPKDWTVAPLVKMMMLSLVLTLGSPLSAYAIDTDGDNNDDSIDLDDDNDGIPDTIESTVCGVNSSFGQYSGVLYDGVSNQDSWAIVSGSPTFPPATGFSSLATFDYAEFAGTPDGFNIIFDEAPFGATQSIILVELSLTMVSMKMR